jgi:hypothetical protein
MNRWKKAIPWLIGILLASLLMGALWLFADPQYTGNDDTPILRSSMGFEGGEPATYHLHTHAAFTWMLYGLAKITPGVAWFSILQLFMLWFSQVVIVKSLCRMAQQKGYPLWAGAALGALFLGAFTLYVSCRITYTVTASLCGAAAVAWLAEADFSAGRRQIFTGVLGGGAMLLCCFFLRMSAALPAACFFVLIFALKFLSARAKPALIALCAVAALFAASAGAQVLDIALQDEREDLQWHDRRIALFDYTGFAQEVPDETLAQIGWSRDELTLVENWFFLNDNITADAFQTLIDQQNAVKAAPTLASRLETGWQDAAVAYSDAKLAFALWCTLCLALAAALRGTKRTLWTLALSLLGGFALTLALGAMGRLNARAAYSVLLPAGAAVYTAFFDAERTKQKPLRFAAACTALAACLALTAFAGVAQVQSSYIPPSPYFTDTTTDLHADLDEIALINEDKLIVCDLSLSHDHRLFPDTSEGIPHNVMLWGGWQAHSPSWRRMLLNFGISSLDSSLFLRGDVLYASTYDQPPQELMNYIGEAADGAVDWTYYDQWGYVNLFAFEMN